MDIRTVAQVIRDNVGMDAILNLYGYRPKRGFMVCPFHGDGNASLKVYSGSRHQGWHCFGCGKGGSVIDFVMEHEGCDFPTAVRAIDKATGLNLTEQKDDPFRAEDGRLLQKSADAYQEAVERLINGLQQKYEQDIIQLLRRVQKAEQKPRNERSVEDWQTISEGEYEMQYLEDLKLQLDEKRKEVAAWRRKVRLLTVAQKARLA